MNKKILAYQNFDEVGSLIKVRFLPRGCDFTTHPKGVFQGDTCLGAAENLWAEVVESVPIGGSLNRRMYAKLKNQPHQIDEKTGKKINIEDICEFLDNGFDRAIFVKVFNYDDNEEEEN